MMKQEEFNIEKYKPSAFHAFYIDSSGDIELDICGFSECLNKRDTIALAKHFKLTSEDLK